MSYTFPSKWKCYKLDQLGLVGRGRSRHRPRNEPSLYGGKYPFYQTGDIKGSNLYLSEYSQTYNEKGLAQSKIWDAGTLCITIAANIAETAILSISGCFPDSVIGFIPYKEKSDVRFIKYYIDLIKLDMQQISHGTTQDNLSLEKLLSFDFIVPDIEEQRKIAAILSAYDDLIENNTRRIKILEEMAQNLYREWFVKFRFPGHEHARFVDSPLGRIPEGWEIVPFSDLVESSLGGGWGSDEPNEKENLPVYIIRGTDFSDITSGATLRAPKRYIAMSSLNKRKLHKGDLLVENSVNAKSRCVGSTLIITDGILKRFSESVIAASFCKVYRFKQPELAPLAHLHMSYLHQEDKMPFYQNIATNGIGNFQSKRFLSSEHLIIPQDSKLRQEMLSLLYDLTNSNLSDAISTLRTTRDLLLPKLISGEVDVSDLDIKIPEAIEA